MSGTFIVFEGGDGVGKSTQMGYLVAWCQERGLNFIATRQPGGTTVGDALRSLVLDPATGHVANRAEALIYAADKAQHVEEVVQPALENGQLVVCDRYVDSMIAYQGAGRDLELAEVGQIAWWAVGGLRPDLTILLDANPDDAVSIKKNKDRLESAGVDFHRRVRQHFLDLAAQRPDEYFVMKALQGRDEMAARIAARVAPLL